MTTFGARLRALRKARGKSQQQVGRGAHVTQAQLSMWEIDKGYPSIPHFAALVSYYKVTPTEILELLSISAPEPPAIEDPY